MHTDSQTIRNDRDVPLAVWLEPWAEELQIPPGKSAVFTAHSEIEGALEVEGHAPLTVFGWSGSELVVEIDGEVVWRSYAPAFALAPGRSLKDYLGIVGLRFGEK
jgi:hypothetical protein